MVRDNRRRVVMAGPLPPAIGGMVSVLTDLAESKLRERFEVELFDTSKQTRPDRSLIEAVAARLGMWRRWLRVLGGRRRPIAHIHTCSGLSYFLDGALALLARVRRAPVVLHVHGGRFDAFIDGLRPVERWAAQFIARRASRVIVLSDTWRDRLQGRLPGAALRVVENAVPMTKATSAAERQGLPLILFLGGLSRLKGVEELVRATAHLKHPARVALVGPEAEAGFLLDLDRLATDLGVKDRLLFPGPADAQAKQQWLTRASIFALPSHVEGLPMALLEAMEAALPAVATPVGAIPAVIEQGRSGFLVEVGDVAALASALDRLLGDVQLRQQMGQRARELCVARFSIDRAVGQLHGMYDELLPA